MGGGKQGADLDVLEPVPRSVLHCLLTAQAMGPNTQTPATTAFLTMMDQTLSNWDRINTSFLTLLWSRVLSQLGNVTKAQSPSHPSWEGLGTLSLTRTAANMVWRLLLLPNESSWRLLYSRDLSARKLRHWSSFLHSRHTGVGFDGNPCLMWLSCSFTYKLAPSAFLPFPSLD